MCPKSLCGWWWVVVFKVSLVIDFSLGQAKQYSIFVCAKNVGLFVLFELIQCKQPGNLRQPSLRVQTEVNYFANYAFFYDFMRNVISSKKSRNRKVSTGSPVITLPSS
jgi:hypothetical protein